MPGQHLRQPVPAGPAGDDSAVRASSASGTKPSASSSAAPAPPAQPVGPLHHADRASERLVESELDELVRRGEPVEVGVPELDLPEIVDLHQGEARATGSPRSRPSAASRAPISARANRLLPAPRPPMSPSMSPAPRCGAIARASRSVAAGSRSRRLVCKMIHVQLRPRTSTDLAAARKPPAGFKSRRPSPMPGERRRACRRRPITIGTP